MKKLAIIATHPVQYYAPVFKLLGERGNIEIRVFYTLGRQPDFDKGFDRSVTWDIPLLEGYPYEFVENVSKEPGSHHFMGIRTPGLVSAIGRFDPDAVLVYGWSYAGHLRAIRYFKDRIPVWFRGDSTLIDPMPPLKRAVRSFVLRWVYSHIDLAFFTGAANRRYFLAAGLKDPQLVFSPHAIDNKRFAEDRRAEAATLRARLGVSPEDVLVLFTGKFEPKKAPLLLIEAFNRLNRPGLHLLLVGDGQLVHTMRAYEEDNPRVTITSFVNQLEIPVYYQACDLFCLPSAGPAESWGLAVNEAMAAGKAVLVSDRAGCAEDLVSEDENGLVFSSGNLASLCQALSDLTGDKSRLARMGAGSLAKIAAYSFEGQVQAFENALNRDTQK